MDGGPPLRGKDTAVEVDRGRFGKLTGSAFQPRSHIWALLRRIDLYFGNSDFHLFGFSPSRPKYAHQPSFLRPCGVADGDIHSRRVSLVDRDTERSRRGPGGLSGSIFSPKLGDFGPFVLFVARSQVNSQQRCFRETENRSSRTWREDGRVIAEDKAEYRGIRGITC